MTPRTARVAAVLGALAAAACAPPRLELPSGGGQPLADLTIARNAVAHCGSITGVSAEIALSGRVGRRRLRGRVLAGVQGDAVRLEGVAPFGAPAFILAASPRSSTLLLPREDRVLTDTPPAEILGALVGVDATPRELRTWLTGCAPTSEPTGGEQYGDAWAVLRLADGSKIYFRRDGTWRLVATEQPAIRIEFGEHRGGQPLQVRLVSRETAAGAAFDLVLRLSQVEVNPELSPGAFEVTVEPAMIPITLEELREAGPLRDDRGG